MALPDLKATLTASTEGFESSLSRAAKAAEDASKQIQSSTEKMGSGFAALKGFAEGALAGLAVDKLVSFVTSTIDAADHLFDLSNKTGLAVETIGGLGFAAKQAGSSVEGVSGGIGKLNLQLAQAAAGNVRAKEAFDALGISVKNADGSTKSADATFIAIADKFASFNEGPEKSALAVRLFGKAGADLIQVLDQGGAAIQEQSDYYKRYSGVTQDLAEKSNQFNDTLTKLKLLSGAFGNTLAAELLPSLQAIADQFVTTKENGDQFKTFAADIAEVIKEVAIAATFGVEALFQFRNATKELGEMGSALASGTLLRDYDAIISSNEGKLEQQKATLASLRDSINGTGKGPSLADRPIDFGQTKGDAPRLPGGKTGKTEDTGKKLLDQQLKELDQYISAEKEALASRNDTLQMFYQRDQVSIGDYYAARKSYRDDALANEEAAYAKEIADLEVYIAKTSAAKDGKSEGKVIEAQTKLIDVRGKLQKVENDAANQNLKDWFAQKDAVDKYHDRLDGLAATIASFSGDTAAAFKSNFAAQNKSLKAQLAAVLDSNNSSQDERNKATQGIIDLDQIKQQGIATAQLNDLSGQRSLILSQLANQQDRLDLSISQGNKSEMQGLADISAANAARVESLRKIIDAQQLIAEGIPDPFAKSQALAQVDAMRVQMEKLDSQTHLVADRFNEIGNNAVENLVNKLGTGTVKAKDLLKGLLSDISSSFLKMQAKDAGNQLFGKGGLLSGIGTFAESVYGGGMPATANGAAGTAATSGTSSGVGGFLSSLFGSGTGGATGASGAAAGTSAALTSLTAAASPLTPVFAALSTAAQAAATALGSISVSGAAGGGGSSGGGLLGSLVAKFGGSTSTSNLPKTDAADFALLDSRSAKGNVFLGGNVIPFARGGMVSSPTMFPMAGGRTGLMGEAGPEAIVPLKRGANGVLGLAGQGGDNLTVHQTFVLDQPTPRQNQGQLVNAAAKALDRRRRTRSA